MPTHIVIGESALEITITVNGHEYWLCIDERQYDGKQRPYYVYTVYRDGLCVMEDEWKHTKTYLAAGDAMEEIIQRWEEQSPTKPTI